MPTAFSEESNFTGISESGNLFISDVIHKSFVDVNEEGTEAAAATGVSMAVMSLPIKEEIPVFRADHPFMFLIQDNENGAVLFAGRVMKPDTT
jgi:serpin B